MYLKKIHVRIFSTQSWEDLKGLTATLLPPHPSHQYSSTFRSSKKKSFAKDSLRYPCSAF